MCIRDSFILAYRVDFVPAAGQHFVDVTLVAHIKDKLVLRCAENAMHRDCLLYTSDAADERSSVDLGGRRIIKKKKNTITQRDQDSIENKHDTQKTQHRVMDKGETT